MWMYRKQLGRRNLTDEQKTYLLGKLYEARKQTRGGDRGNQYTKEANRQSGDLATGRTVMQIAKEQGVGQKTVERAEHFAKGLDAIREVSPAVATALFVFRAIFENNILCLRMGKEAYIGAFLFGRLHALLTAPQNWFP